VIAGNGVLRRAARCVQLTIGADDPRGEQLLVGASDKPLLTGLA
jgi:hypothetical protein